jgi:hypothetical protein
MPRELVRWLQTLDLPQQVRNPKRDMSNGYLAAEICARYWSNVDLHQYDNGTSTKVKQSNWTALSKAMAKNNANLPPALVQDVIAAKDDAGRQLLEALYTLFTNRVLQRAAPLEVAELPQVPTYVKPQRQHDPTLQQQQHIQHQQQQLQQAQQQMDEEQAQLEKEAAAEAEKRRQQKLSASVAAKKPKAPVKVQAIRAADDEEVQEDLPKLQFSGVTVKPLSGQALARLGVGRVANARRPAAAAPGAAEPARQSAGDGVLVNLSAAIDATLRDTAAPSWAVPPGTTSVEYFAQYHARIPPAVKDAIWGSLYAAIDETTSWLVARPGDVGTFAAAFMPAVATDAVQTTLGRAHYAFTGLDGANSSAYVKCVFANMAKRRLSYAVTCAAKSVLPLIVPTFVRLGTSAGTRFAAASNDDAVAAIDAIAALCGCGVESPSVAETRVRNCLSTLHHGFLGGAARSSGDVDTTARYLAFLLAVDMACGLPCSGATRANSATPRPDEHETSRRYGEEGSSPSHSVDGGRRRQQCRLSDVPARWRRRSSPVPRQRRASQPERVGTSRRRTAVVAAGGARPRRACGAAAHRSADSPDAAADGWRLRAPRDDLASALLAAALHRGSCQASAAQRELRAGA